MPRAGFFGEISVRACSHYPSAQRRNAIQIGSAAAARWTARAQLKSVRQLQGLCEAMVLNFKLGSQGKSSVGVLSKSKQLLSCAWDRIANQKSRKSRASRPETTVQMKLIRLRSRRGLSERELLHSQKLECLTEE